MLKVTDANNYDVILRNIQKRGGYAIEEKSNRKILLKGERQLAMLNGKTQVNDNKIDKKTIKNLFRTVRASVTKYLNKKNFIIASIEKKHPPYYFNYLLWQKLSPGDEFYHIDANHCYWRIAYLLGYIGKGLYEKYCNVTELKLLRNIALAILNSRQKMLYYDEAGQKINEITCDNSIYQTVYNNIRYYSYNLCGEIKEAIPDCCISYRIDAVVVTKKGLKKAIEIYRSKGMEYKVNKCMKIDEEYFETKAGEIKKI